MTNTTNNGTWRFGAPCWPNDKPDRCAFCDAPCDGNPQTTDHYVDGLAFCSSECLACHVTSRIYATDMYLMRRGFYLDRALDVALRFDADTVLATSLRLSIAAAGREMR